MFSNALPEEEPMIGMVFIVQDLDIVPRIAYLKTGIELILDRIPRQDVEYWYVVAVPLL